MNLTYITFRFAVCVYTLIIAYLSYDIYKMTKGGTTPWKYFAFANIVGFLWAITTLLFLDILKNLFLLYIIQPVLLLILIYFIIKVTYSFPKSYMVKIPKWFNEKILFSFIGLILILLTGYNLYLGSSLRILSTLIGFVVGLCFVLFGFSFYFVSKYQKNLGWRFLVIYGILLGLAMVFRNLLSSCCGITPDLIMCQKLYPPPEKFFPSLVCSQGLLSLYSFGDLLAVISSLFMIGIYLIWKHIRKSFRIE